MNSKNTLLIIIILIFIGIIWIRLKTKQPNDEKAIYKKKKPLTEVETKLYYLLKKALPEFEILAQVDLKSLIEAKINALTTKSQNYKWHNAISQQSVDFVICKPVTLEIVIAIELDDKSHESKGRKEADEKKERNLNSAGIHLIRWRANNLPKEHEIEPLLVKQLSMEITK